MDDSDSDSVDSDATTINEVTVKDQLTGIDAQLSSLNTEIDRRISNNENLEELSEILTNHKGSLNKIINDVNNEEEDKKRATVLLRTYIGLNNKIDDKRRSSKGGQRSKIKKRRFKSNKSNKSKGRKRSSRRRRISGKRICNKC